jgi:thiamine biosynthesis protein ThiI
MKKRILIRFGDMMLKGQNIGFFIKRVRKHIMTALADLSVTYVLRHDRIMIDYDLGEETVLIERLKRISGIHDFSIAHVTTPDIEAIIKEGILLLDETAIKDGTTFKIETRRTNKSFPMTSLEITQNVAKEMIKGTKHHLVVDVKHPELTLYIEFRIEAAYLYVDRIKGMGGYPYGTGGKGLLMMSGGIDSPVAGYLAMKQGIEVELMHFESTPLTPIESVQKVIDLSRILATYTMNQNITLHLVPFAKLHHAILDHIPEPYMITIMRRMMYRIAERFTKKKKIYALINGESVGQVASQTLQSMQVVEAVTKLPVLRPLITYDKLEIIALSKEMGAYDISIKPFNDCCSIYVPKQPVTKPMELYASKYETYVPYESLIEAAIEHVITIQIHAKDTWEMSTYGFDVKEAFDRYQKEMSEMV